MDVKKPINPDRFFSTVARRWTPDPMREIGLLWFGNEDRIINFGAGLPKNDAMPFKSMDITLKDGSKYEVKGQIMDSANQYNLPKGLKEAWQVFWDLLIHLHQPPTASIPRDQGGLDMIVLSGSTEGTHRAMELILDPGDIILMDEPMYASHIHKARNLGLKTLGVKTDIEGLIPQSLRETLCQWSPADALKRDSDIPKVLLTVPNASNPTGFSISENRKKEIYKICREYDIIILEDDPYYYLLFDQICREYDIIILEDDPYYYLLFDQSPSASYLALDEDGRVIRLDSFSKLFSPGFRCGVMSGHSKFLERILLNSTTGQNHPSTLPQVIYYEILQSMGIEGFLDYAKKLCSIYKEQRNIMVEAANQHLKGLVEFNVPSGGMFLWMKILGLKDTKEMVKNRAADRGILAIPGSYFLPEPCDSPYVRVSFATPSHKEIDEGMKRFAALVKDELSSQK